MKHVEVNPHKDSFGVQLGTDEGGCLFDRRLREGLGAMVPDRVEEIEAIAALRLAGRGLHLMMERWAETHGLSEGRLQVLMRLKHGGEATLGDLADVLHVSPRNITGLIDILERDGLVERVPAPHDRRSVHARLTESGRARIEAIWRQALVRQIPLVAGLDVEELRQLRHLCLRLVENMSELARRDTHAG